MTAVYMENFLLLKDVVIFLLIRYICRANGLPRWH